MSTACYDRPPEPPRNPIRIAGDLVRRGDKLSIEAAKALKELANWQRYAAYCNCCAKSGEPTPMDFDAFLANSVFFEARP